MRRDGDGHRGIKESSKAGGTIDPWEISLICGESVMCLDRPMIPLIHQGMAMPLIRERDWQSDWAVCWCREVASNAIDLRESDAIHLFRRGTVADVRV